MVGEQDLGEGGLEMDRGRGDIRRGEEGGGIVGLAGQTVERGAVLGRHEVRELDSEAERVAQPSVGGRDRGKLDVVQVGIGQGRHRDVYRIDVEWSACCRCGTSFR